MEVLGIDIGGSGVKGALVNTNTGELLTKRYRIPTPTPATPKAVAETIKTVVDYFAWKGKIGCGFPAIIQNGVARSAANIDNSFIGTDIVQLFSDQTGCQIHVLNDADAAGYAEMKFGAGRNSRGVVVIITVGTGIGTAVFTNGILLPNTEFGHLILDNQATAEVYASDATRKRDALSWKGWAKRFDKYLAYLEFLLSPNLIIIGGGVSKKMDKFLKYLNRRAEVVPGQLLNQAGIIGAALAVEMNCKN